MSSIKLHSTNPETGCCIVHWSVSSTGSWALLGAAGTSKVYEYLGRGPRECNPAAGTVRNRSSANEKLPDVPFEKPGFYFGDTLASLSLLDQSAAGAVLGPCPGLVWLALLVMPRVLPVLSFDIRISVVSIIRHVLTNRCICLSIVRDHRSNTRLSSAASALTLMSLDLDPPVRFARSI